MHRDDRITRRLTTVNKESGRLIDCKAQKFQYDILWFILNTLCLCVIRWSVNQDEIRKFEAMAKSWWDPFGPFMPLHQLNPARVRYES